MCLDSDMPGPAQRYLVYGLQAARESKDPRAPLVTVRILADPGQQLRWADDEERALDRQLAHRSGAHRSGFGEIECWPRSAWREHGWHWARSSRDARTR